MFKVNNSRVNNTDSRTTSLHVFPVSLFVIFKHVAHLALEFLLLNLSR